MDPRRRSHLPWIALSTLLPLAALQIYTLSEWLFFVTKPSPLSALSWPDRLLALAGTPWPFVPMLLALQAPFTLLSLVPRWRAIAVVPAGAILGCLALILIDNFTHVLFGFSSGNVDLRLRTVYVVAILAFVILASNALRRSVVDGWGDGRTRLKVAAVCLLAAPSLAAYAALHREQLRIDSFAEMTASPVVADAAADNDTPLNVLLLSSDGVEARRLSAYGYAKPTTPALESLRDESLFFENAFANSCRTYGSVVSLLTGKLPLQTRVLDPPSMLEGDARYQHLPGILRKRGYLTLQLTVWHYADADAANLVGAFDLANYDWEGWRLRRLKQTTDSARQFRLQMAERLTDRLLRVFGGVDRDSYRAVSHARKRPVYWRDERKVDTLLRFIEWRREPWFAHVHLLDSHQPDEGESFDYDAAIRSSDDSMGRIVDGLRRMGQLERTIIVVSSDHGRGWQARERVPLLIRFPNGRHARRESGNVQLADVAPTILDELRLPIPEWMDGKSLLRPEQLHPNRSVMSICGFVDEEPAPGHRDAAGGPPGYRLSSASVVVGSWWYEFSVTDGVLTRGPVDGHSQPGPPANDATARTIVANALMDHGLQLGSGAAPAGGETSRP